MSVLKTQTTGRMTPSETKSTPATSLYNNDSRMKYANYLIPSPKMCIYNLIEELTTGRKTLLGTNSSPILPLYTASLCWQQWLYIVYSQFYVKINTEQPCTNKCMRCSLLAWASWKLFVFSIVSTGVIKSKGRNGCFLSMATL